MQGFSFEAALLSHLRLLFFWLITKFTVSGTGLENFKYNLKFLEECII